MSAASSDSRHTISSVSNTPSPYQQRAAALLVEIVEELVPAGSESGDVDGRRLPRLDHALAVQLEALELDRCRGPIGHLETHAGTGRRLDLRRREPCLLDGKHDCPILARGGAAGREEECKGDRGWGAERHGELKTLFNFTQGTRGCQAASRQATGDAPRARCVGAAGDRKSTRLNSSHQIISYAVFCLK